MRLDRVLEVVENTSGMDILHATFVRACYADLQGKGIAADRNLAGHGSRKSRMEGCT